MKTLIRVTIYSLLSFLLGFFVSVAIFEIDLIRFPRTIYRTDNGFVPRSIRIEAGQTVRFINKSHRSMWPASNTHPNHLAYPEFDPKRTIRTNGIWEFTFLKEGAWKYHDHIAPYFTGYVVVGKKGDTFFSSACKTRTVGMRENCWDDMFEEAFDKKGLSAGLTMLEDLYKNDALFREQGCHQHGHRVGEMIYGRFIKGKDIKKILFPSTTGYCGFGVMHGIFEHLFRDMSDISYAAEACDYLGKQFSSSVPGIRVNCIHGIGHGFMPDPPFPSVYGNPRRMIDKALLVCDSPLVSRTREELDQCLQGVFNVLVYWMVKNQYGLSLSEEGYFNFCESLDKDEQKDACIAEFSMQLIKFTGPDVQALVKRFIDPIPDTLRKQYVLGFAVPSIVEATVSQDNLSGLITSCMALSEKLRSTCVSSVAGGLFAHGSPGEEYKKVFDLCASRVLGKTEKKDCYTHALRQLPYHYTVDRIKTICEELSTDLQAMCLEAY